MISYFRNLFIGSKPIEDKNAAFKFFPKKNVKPVNYTVNKTISALSKNKLSKSILETVNRASSIVDKKAQLARQERSLYAFFVGNITGGFAKSSMTDIAAVVNHCKSKANEDRVTEQEKKDFITLFNKLSQLPKTQFDAKFFLAGQDKLQRILSPELDKLMKAQQADPALKNNKDHQLEVAIAEADLAVRMGAGGEQAGGCNGAVIIKNLNGKAIGVFKSPPVAGIDFSRTMKNYFGQARLFDRSNPMNEAYAERAMYIFSEMFGLDLAPAAKTVQLQNKEGAFIAFLGEHKQGKYEAFENVSAQFDTRSKDSYSKDEIYIWQMLTTCMGITLNMDGHDGNIFVCMEDNKLVSGKLIDAGNCFPQYLPGEWGSKGHRAAPASHPISEIEFLPEIKDFIKKGLTDDKFEKFVERVTTELPGFWNAQMDALHRTVFDRLKNGVETGEIKSPKDLLNVITEEDFRKLKSESKPESESSLTQSFVAEFGGEDDLFASAVFL